MLQGNKVYVAGKVGKSEAAIKHLIKRLQDRGYEITYDWTLAVIPRPFEEHQEEAAAASEAMLMGILHADIIVVCVPIEGGAGLFVESGGGMVGGAVQAYIQGQRNKRIYAVGEGNGRSIFFFHPSVKRVKTVEDLMEDHLPPIEDAQAAE